VFSRLFQTVLDPFQYYENEVQETIQLKLIDLKTNNNLEDLYKEITDKNTNLIHFYKTHFISDDFVEINYQCLYLHYLVLLIFANKRFPARITQNVFRKISFD